MTDQMIDFVVNETSEKDELPHELWNFVQVGQRMIAERAGKAQQTEAAKQIETEKRRQAAEERIVKAYQIILPDYLHPYILIEPFDVHYGPARVELDLVVPGFAPVRFYLEAIKPDTYKLTAFRVAGFRAYSGEYGHLGLENAIYSIEYRYNPDTKAFQNLEDLPVALAGAHQIGLQYADHLKEIERLKLAEDRFEAEHSQDNPAEAVLMPIQHETIAQQLYKVLQLMITETIYGQQEQA